MGAVPDNRTTCQHADLRFGPEGLDDKFSEIVNELEDSYYGTAESNDGPRANDGWKHGASHPWHGFDVQPTVEQSKALFDEFHGLLWTAYKIIFDVFNMERPVNERVPLEDYKLKQDPKGGMVNEVAQAIAKLAASSHASAIRSVVEAKFGRGFSWL